MPSVIHPEIKVAEIVQRYPETRSVFISHGLGALVSEDGMRVLSPFLPLSTALRSRLISQDTFIDLLHQAIVPEEHVESPGLESYDKQGELSLLALMPCGLKMGFGRALTGFLEELEQNQGMAVSYAVEGNVNQELSYYSFVNTINEVSELPDIIVSADFNSFFGNRFYKRFVETGLFTGYGSVDPTEAYTNAGIIDPLGHYHVMGINPLVMVANLDQIGERQLPQTWQDLLSSQWKRSVTLRGGNGFFCHAVLLPTYQQYGDDGLRALSANVFQGLHPSQMVKQIDANGPGAIYVMPEFFAHRVKHQERVKIIWPEDGALASPVTLQTKADRIDELRPVLDYLTGPELAQSLVGARFPVPHKSVQAEVQNKPLYWLGWDYLRNHDLLALNEEIDRVFMPGVQIV
ncbi:ABC transporter substrate-binding protein [Desulfogranum japonicum]|uniref:ABC transporter substrate-binding protein n=1 Tax=Desulfogranum japonicum TaxID=231447 RepID=UPI000418E464|nr:ABC transporter substrate-binding protein [Desulfogranum japonicum]